MRKNSTTLQITLSVYFRKARANDLEALEWHGLFTEHREIIRDAFLRQTRGENVMILALHNEQPVGQCWIDLTKRNDGKTGVLWALRVVPWLQDHGIGKALMQEAEAELKRKSFARAELYVDKWNSAVIPFYERLGYRRLSETVLEGSSFLTHSGELRHTRSEQWLFSKDLDSPIETEPRLTHAQPVHAKAVKQKKRRTHF